MNFTPHFIKTDVTSIKVFKNVTFVGIGATLHVFCHKTSKIINKVNISETRGEQIFGIIPFSSGDRIVLVCGNFLLLLTTNRSYNFIDEVHRATLNDWILEAKLLNNETKIATVSMQNKFQTWDLDLNLIETLKCEERCILYSAHICYADDEKLTILSGTVFNEILVWKPSKNESNYCPVLRRLQKHEGVLFSLQYNEQNGLICSTSDDRSAVLWKIDSGDLHLELKKETANIFQLCRVYGHQSRVFRCLILNDCFVTAGEDSIVNIWSFDGKLKRQVEAHQGSPVWAVDYDEHRNLLLTGGGNGGVYGFAMNHITKQEKLELPQNEKPKLVGILASNNVIVFSESGVLYLNKNTNWIAIKAFEDLKSYVVLKVSRCRRLVALAGFQGQLYIYKGSNETLRQLCTYQAKNPTRIISLHWLTCELFLLCQEGGHLTLFHLEKSKIIPVASFILPASSQRCSTSAAMLDETIVVGDRKGSLHLYEIGSRVPLQSLPRVQSHLGVTNLIVNDNNLISLGRNSVIKRFSKTEGKLKLISSDKVPFSWLLDLVDDLLIAFSGDNFVVYDYSKKRVLLDRTCGGGHRSWDFSKSDNLVNFVYIKDKFINKIEYSLEINKSFDLVQPYHLKEVNCMEIIEKYGRYVLISGGEDTTLRLTSINEDLSDFKNLFTLKSHLSSIRCITTHKVTEETYLIISAGGRAQIICWTLEYRPVDDLICRENHSYYEDIDKKESETRIMDLTVLEIHERIILFAACSDGFIKVFFVEKTGSYVLKLHANIFYKLKCIFKIFSIKVLGRDVLVTLASDGNLTFWDVRDMFLNQNVAPFRTIPVHQSGINTFSKFEVNSTSFVFLTAGDDNTVALNYLDFKMNDDVITVEVIDAYFNRGVHWAQITGTFITNNYFLTASVDQRLILFEWEIQNGNIVASPVSKYNSSIADIKGIVCFPEINFDVFVYGLGMEYLKLGNK